MQKTNTIKGVSKQQVLLLLVMSFLLPGMLLLFNSVLPFIGQVSVVRWLVVTLLPVVVATHGLYNKSLVMSGALTGIVLTQVLTLAHYGFLTQLFVFFVGGSRVTKFRQQRKQLLEEHFREGGERDGMQVLCTAGTAAVLSVLYLLQCGAGEHWLQLHSHCTHICLAVLGSFACAAGDTFSSEVGSVVGVTDPLLITTLRRVPRGTNGAVSLAGTLASAVGGTLVGLAHYLTLTLLLPAHPTSPTSPPQHSLVWLGTLAGVLGSVLDSVLGATLQYSGLHSSGRVVSRPGPGVVHITGRRVMSNTTVNLVSGVITAITIPALVFITY